MEQLSLNLPVRINSNLNCGGRYPEIENRLIQSDGKLYIAGLEYDTDCQDYPLVDMLDPRIDWVIYSRAIGTCCRINGEYDGDPRLPDAEYINDIIQEILDEAERLQEEYDRTLPDDFDMDEYPHPTDFIEQVDAEYIAKDKDPHDIYEFLLGRDVFEYVNSNHYNGFGSLGRKVQEVVNIIESQYHILPISLYNHSGYRIFSGSMRDWDCGVIGYALCSKDAMTYEDFEQELDNALSDYDDLLNGRVYAVTVEQVNILKGKDHKGNEFLEISRGDFEDSISGIYGGLGDNLDTIKQGLGYMIGYDWIEDEIQYQHRRNYDGEPLQKVINKIYNDNNE